MYDAIARQLGSLYRELVDCQPFSATVQVDLSRAGASGRVRRLLIFQCDCEDLTLLSMFCRWWVVDAADFHADAKPPLTNAMVQEEDWELERPYIKFATDGRRVRFGMKLGPMWYVVREGPLGADGRFMPGQLENLFWGVD